MAWIFAGLGNPGEEYTGSRHNIGRDIVRALAKKEKLLFKADKKLRAEVAKGELFGGKAMLVLPDSYMNNSGASLKSLVDTKKKAEQLVVIHDDLDIPLGKIKMSFGSGAGGHRGVESVQKALKTRDFVRIRVGVCPTTPSGKMRKPDREAIVDFVLGTFRTSEEETLKKIRKAVFEALERCIEGDYASAMNVVNSR